MIISHTPEGSHYDFTEEIDRGVEWLDQEAGPNWFDHINLDKLDLSGAHICVLGQLAMTDFRERLTAHLISRGEDPKQTALSFNSVVAMYGWFGTRTDPYYYSQVARKGFDLPQTATWDDETSVDLTVHPNRNRIWEHLTIQWKERIEKLRANAGTVITRPED